MGDNLTLEELRKRMQNLRILLSFMKGDSRIPDSIRWGFSIDSKVNAMGILYEEVLSQIPKCSDEFKASEKEGMGEYVQCLILAIKYEVFLNSIYALCENLSRIVHYLYGRSVPQGFRKQKKKLLEDRTIDPHYSKILEQTTWYDEVHAIRTEPTHYLSGMVGITSPSELAYFNLPKSQRLGTPKSISIPDIRKHAMEVYRRTLTFVSDYGDHFIGVINQDSHVTQTCLVDQGRIFTKTISLREYLNGQAGVCQTTAIDCPQINSCKARRK